MDESTGTFLASACLAPARQRAGASPGVTVRRSRCRPLNLGAARPQVMAVRPPYRSAAEPILPQVRIRYPGDRLQDSGSPETSATWAASGASSPRPQPGLVVVVEILVGRTVTRPDGRADGALDLRRRVLCGIRGPG
ncbi:hypothetical protein GCM10027176_82010 [Actinoallomurus bryophytorum]|uniref:hypothetical protein n=1 Tax=Actinoallomurus bryophytorum TaxID=1490222 RepID=UPI001153B051|nr:hypothetical protein [Actinoallomurus bryophytorum]